MKTKFLIPSRFRPVFQTAFLASSAFVMSGSLLNAAGVWDGGSAVDAFWDSADNWDDDLVPALGSDVTIQDPFTSGNTISTNGDRTAGSLTFGNGSATGDTLSGESGDTLSITAGIAFSNSTGGGSSTLSVPTVSVGANDTLWTGDGSRAAIVNSAITGSGLITKGGSHNLRLRGDNSGFAGGFTIEKGNLNARSSAIDDVFGTGTITFATVDGQIPSVSMNINATASWANEIINDSSGNGDSTFSYQGDAFTAATVSLTGDVSTGPNIVDAAKMVFKSSTGYSSGTYGEGRWNLSGDWSGYMPTNEFGEPKIVAIAGTLQFDAQQAIAPTPVRFTTAQLPDKSYAGNLNIESGILGATTKIILNGPFTMANTTEFQSGAGLYGTGLSGLTCKSLGSSNNATTTATISGAIAQYTSAAVNLFCLNDGATLDITGSVVGGNAANNLFINDVYSYATGAPLDSTGSSLVNMTPAGTVIFNHANSGIASNVGVMGGTLLVNGSMTGGSPVTVAPGAKLGGIGSIVGPASLDAGAGLAFTISSDSASHSPLDFGDDLTLVGASTVTIESGAGAEEDTYTVATSVNGITGALPTLIKPASMSATLAFNGNDLELTITDVGETGTPYDTWAASFGLSGLTAADDFDADLDGIDNLTEYGLGTSPIASSTQPAVSINGSGYAEFSFTRPNDRTDITSVGQYSTDLGSWSSSATLVETNVVDNLDGTETITVTEAASAPATDEAFLRLLVEKI